MCGSVALLNRSHVSEAAIRAALKCLESRGPDGSGVLLNSFGAVGHCRLALRDAVGGAQPRALSDGRILAFVGEIYNDQKLRALLQIAGRATATESDTEVLAHAIEHWGEETWNKLDAMFAVMLLTQDGGQLKLIRDRFGIKPLFYARTESEVAAASQPSALRDLGCGQTASAQGLIHFLRTSQVSCHDQTVWSDIRLTPPGTSTTLCLESANQNRWSTIADLFRDQGAEPATPSKLIHLLGEAVYRQSQADFPVGVFLSGGLDSSLLAALLSRSRRGAINTFAIALQGDTEDIEFARIVAGHIQSKHDEFIISPEEFFTSMRELIQLRALPLSLPNEVLIYRLSLSAGKKVKAVLSGEGADELFAGYQRLFARLRYGNADSSSLLKAYRNATSWFTMADLSEFIGIEIDLPEYEKKDLTRLALDLDGVPSDRAFQALLLADHFPHLLLRLDGASMAGSIEGRVPFTDPDVVRFALQLQSSELDSVFGLEKPILRKAAMGHLPEEVIRRPKRPFHASLQSLFSSTAGQFELSRALNQPLITKLFAQEKLERILSEDRKSQVFHRTWLICSLGMWSELCRVSEIC